MNYIRFHDYPMLGGRTIADEDDKSLKETRRAETRATEEIKRLARDQARRKDTLAREQTIEKDLETRKTKESEKHAADEIRQFERDQARKRDTLAREQAIEKNQKARKLKAKNQ